MKTYSSILPGAVLLLAAVLFLRYATQWDSFPAFVGIYPYVVWVAGMLLGLRFNRSRLVFSVMVLAVADQALLRYVPAGSAGDDADPIVFRAVAFLLPLNLAAISLITERGFGTPRGMARLGLILSQLVLVGWIIRPEQAGRASWLGRPLFEIGITDWSALPQPALPAFGGAFALRLSGFFSIEVPSKADLSGPRRRHFLACMPERAESRPRYISRPQVSSW